VLLPTGEKRRAVILR